MIWITCSTDFARLDYPFDRDGLQIDSEEEDAHSGRVRTCLIRASLSKVLSNISIRFGST